MRKSCVLAANVEKGLVALDPGSPLLDVILALEHGSVVVQMKIIDMVAFIATLLFTAVFKP